MIQAILRLLFIAACVGGFHSTASAQTFRVNVPKLSLRTEPSTTGGDRTIVGTLNKNDLLSAGHDRWMRVAVQSGVHAGKTGYVLRHGTAEADWEESKAMVTRVASQTSYFVSGVNRFANLRNAASTSAPIIGKIPKGDFVVSLDTKPAIGQIWHYVQVVDTGRKGWVSGEFLSKN